MKLIRKLKGALMAITFLCAAIGLYLQRGIGVISYLGDIGISPLFLICGFALSGLAMIYITVYNSEYNLVWYIPFMLYTGATWSAVYERLIHPENANTPPIVAACFYTLLLGILILDWYQDWKKLYGAKPR